MKNYSNAFASDIQSHLDEGEAAFELMVLTRLPSAMADLSATSKTILYGLVAYDLGTTSWLSNGKSVTLSATYAAGKLSIVAVYA